MMLVAQLAVSVSWQEQNTIALWEHSQFVLRSQESWPKVGSTHNSSLYEGSLLKSCQCG